MVLGQALYCCYLGGTTRTWSADMTHQNWGSMYPIETFSAFFLSRAKAT